MYDLGLRIKEFRIQRGLTQATLARKINKTYLPFPVTKQILKCHH